MTRTTVGSGDDDFGLSEGFIRLLDRSLFRFLREVYFRAEYQGLERIPAEGPVVLVGIHRGFVPLDAMLTLHVVRRERGRTPRFLVHPGVLRFRPIAAVIRRIGGVLARQENAQIILARGGVLGLFPEGVRGPFRLHRDTYRVGRFLTSDYVEWARHHGATLVPYVTVGPAEAFPILGKLEWRWWRRFTLWPFLPLTPLFPWLPLPIPLPSKWHTKFLEPMTPAQLAAADRREISRGLRDLLQRELTALKAERRSVFRGSIFESPRGRPPPGSP